MTTNKELLALREANTPRGVGTQTNIFADRALNAEVWDVEGNRYIDLAAGIAVVNTGHNHPEVMAAVRAPFASDVFGEASHHPGRVPFVTVEVAIPQLRILEECCQFQPPYGLLIGPLICRGAVPDALRGGPGLSF